jgi:hypothetical protein
VHDINRVVDVESHCIWRRRVAGAVEIDQNTHQADNRAQARRVLAARHGRLRAQVGSAVRQSSAGEFESRVRAQPVEIVSIFITAGDGEDARPQDVRQPMDHAHRIAPIANHRRKLGGDAELTFGRGQQNHPTIRRDPSAIESGCDLLAVNGWKSEGQHRIVNHGGCGRR